MPNLATKIFFQYVKWTSILMLLPIPLYFIPGWIGLDTTVDTSTMNATLLSGFTFVMGGIFIFCLYNIPVCGVAGLILLTQAKYKGYGLLGLVAAIGFFLYVKYVVGNGF